MKQVASHLPGKHGDIPLMLWRGEAGPLSGLHIIHCPAFGEEMNKSRHLVAAAARRLAHQGACVWVPDVHGTGDSAGEFSAANWDDWLDDLSCCIQKAMECHAGLLVFWGCRLGALAATELAQRYKDQSPALLLWQPVFSGKQFLRQFFRLATVSAAAFGDEDTLSPERQLLEGDSTDIAGYRITSSAYEALVKRTAVPPAQLSCTNLTLLEVSPETEKSLSPKYARWLEDKTESQHCTGLVCAGDLFWASQELGYSPALLDATENALLSVKSQQAVPDESEHDAAPLNALPQSNTTFLFPCGDDSLVGHLRRAPNNRKTGVLIVVGGPQYRTGSHRMFVKLADRFAAAGFSTMSFDYRGMGDASGTLPGFENTAKDIQAAQTVLMEHEPSITEVVIWGLCDGATAAVLGASESTATAALILANPWVYSEDTKAQALISTHYRGKLVSREFWGRLLTGKVNLFSALGGFASVLRQSQSSEPKATLEAKKKPTAPESLAKRFFQALNAAKCPTQIVLSGRDVTAAEFDIALSASDLATTEIGLPSSDPTASQTNLRPKDAMAGSRYLLRMPGADHTFSKISACDALAAASIQFLEQVDAAPGIHSEGR